MLFQNVLLLASSVAATIPLVVIASGSLVGTSTTLPGATKAVNKYLGIPYASSPPLRFAPPEPPKSWKRHLDATKWKPSCLQQFGAPSVARAKIEETFNNPGGLPPPESEDCLYLNIYAPAGATRGSDLPVLFWIYGGGFQFGTGSMDVYDGSSFAYHQNVIVVTFNYRMNVFGFANAPGIYRDEQNAGLLDQRLALSWVHTNINAFGGDPSKVTVFGESAGGVSVKQLFALPPQPSMFRAGIIQSQSTPTSDADLSAWNALVKKFGCSGSSSELECMRRPPGERIQSVVNEKSLMFVPISNNISYVKDIRTAFSNGTFSRLPLLLGTNRNEARVFAWIAGLDDPLANLTSVLPKLLPSFPGIETLLDALTAPGQIPYLAVSAVMTELEYLCPASQIAARAQQAGLQIWRYIYDAAFPNTQTFRDAGSYHSSEIRQVFGTYYTANGNGPSTDIEIALSAYMQRSWANFAKNPSAGPGWLDYGLAHNVASLGGANRSGSSILPAWKIDVPCSLGDPFTDDMGL